MCESWPREGGCRGEDAERVEERLVRSTAFNCCQQSDFSLSRSARGTCVGTHEGPCRVETCGSTVLELVPNHHQRCHKPSPNRQTAYKRPPCHQEQQRPPASSPASAASVHLLCLSPVFSPFFHVCHAMATGPKMHQHFAFRLIMSSPSRRDYFLRRLQQHE